MLKKKSKRNLKSKIIIYYYKSSILFIAKLNKLNQGVIIENDTPQLNPGVIIKMMDYLYEKSLNGLPGMPSAKKLAEDYLKNNNGIPLVDKAWSLVRWQELKTGITGFVTGLGGIITLPVAVPADVTGQLYVNTRMAAAIAYMGGYDLDSDQTKSFVYATIAGMSVADVVKRFGVSFGYKLGEKLVTKIPGAIIIKINKLVGFRLLTKFGTKGLVNLVKFVPLLGGAVGGAVDVVGTRSIGSLAIKNFIKNPENKNILNEKAPSV